jgi:hypothetical protein
LFWHFSDFGDVLTDITTPLDVRDPEDVIGERAAPAASATGGPASSPTLRATSPSRSRRHPHPCERAPF